MQSTESQILDLIRKGEGLDLEFKGCRNQLNRDVYETVCAFLNRHGGTLLLGVLDSGEIQGLEPEAVAHIRKDFDPADELGSGMHKMMLYGKKYGDADPELIEGDIFRMVISVPEFGANPAEVPQIVSAKQPSGQVAGQVTGQVTGQVLNLLKVALLGERSRKELMEAIGLTGRDNFEKLYLRPALDAELIEMTIPDKPNSRYQKYRMTEKGKKMVMGREP